MCFLKLFFCALFFRFLNIFIFFIVFQYVKNIFRFVFQIKTLKIKEKFLSIAPVLTQKVTKWFTKLFSNGIKKTIYFKTLQKR